MTSEHLHPEVAKLLERAHALAADRRNTNYGGGNVSCKAVTTDPVTLAATELLWVKGSGGDLATLTEDGLAVLRLDRLRALGPGYPNAEDEDEMFRAFDFCQHGTGPATPSIDTAMHGLVASAHVDHLHPDSGIAFATAADGKALTAECFGNRVLWIDWRRPGFGLGMDIAHLARDHPNAIGVILGGHGITAWGSSSDECEARSREIIDRIRAYIDTYGRPDPFGAVVRGREPLTELDRKRRAADLFPPLRGMVSSDRRQVGFFSDAPEVLDFLSRSEMPRLAALGTSCPDHFLRTKIRPMVLDLDVDAPLAEALDRFRQLLIEYRRDYQSYYERHASSSSPPMRGADPAIVLVPGVGMFSFGVDAKAARIAGEFYASAINVMRGAEAVSTYQPITESEKFGIEYWALEEAKLQRLPKPKPLASRVAFVTGGGSGIGRAIAHRLAAEGASVVVADIDSDRAVKVAEEIGGRDVAIGVAVDVADEAQIEAALRHATLRFGGIDILVNNAGLSLSKSLMETTTEDWDIQHRVMARGSFMTSRATAGLMIPQGLGGDIVYIVSKNAIVAGPDNVAYGAAKADQAHQVRLLAAELAQYGVRVNGINPDAVVRGSGIFAGGWGARRASAYGVPEDQLGEFYAQRTLLKLEVLPEHVAAAVYVLVAGELSRTTGHLIPVDAGLAAAFLR